MRSDTHRIEAVEVAAVLRESGVEQAPPVPVQPAPQPVPGTVVLPLAQQLAALERQAIAAAMAQARGNKAAAARMLGISRATLYGRLQESV